MNWLPIVGYEGIYEVSEAGDVRRILASQGTRAGPVKSHVGTRGYVVVNLCKQGKRCVKYVHQIVCEAFHGPAPMPNMEPNHDDRNRTNNHKDNLYWVTRSQNNLHMWQGRKQELLAA